jgi:hypothetical protein
VCFPSDGGFALFMRRFIKPQILRSLSNFHHRLHHITHLARQWQQAAPRLLAHPAAGLGHAKKHTPILQRSWSCMVRQILCNGFGQLVGRNPFARHSMSYQPCRARRLVMCEVWCRECQS